MNTEETDYKTLLRKYMQKVLDNEGITFVSECFYRKVDGSKQTTFTDLEEISLKEIEKLMK